MPTIDIYYFPPSPPCRAVEMVANLAGVTLNKHHLNMFEKDHLKEDYLKINPLHRIPFIIDGDLKINESRAIAAYLVNRYMPNDDQLYPKDPVQRARVDELLYIDMGVYGAGVNLMRPRVIFGAKEYDPQAEETYRELVRQVDYRLQTNGGKKFMLGDEYTLADISFAATFSYPEMISYDLSEFKALTAYIERLKTAIPKYAEINEKTIESTKAHVKAKLESA